MDSQTSPERQLVWDGCLNVRDLGGYATNDGLRTRWKAIVRSGQPSALSEGGLNALVAYGIRSIVDLRRPFELEQYPNPFAQAGDHGIVYTNVSLIDPLASIDVFAGLSDAYTLADAYCALLDRDLAHAGRIMQAIARAPDGAVLVHCAAGQDRTGVICALLLDLAGVDRETIAVDYAYSDGLLSPSDADWLANGPGTRTEREQEVARFAAHPEVIIRTLEHVAGRYGGSEGYLHAAGLQASEITRLRERLVEPPATTAL